MSKIMLKCFIMLNLIIQLIAVESPSTSPSPFPPQTGKTYLKKWLAEVQNTTIYWIQATEFISW